MSIKESKSVLIPAVIDESPFKFGEGEILYRGRHIKTGDIPVGDVHKLMTTYIAFREGVLGFGGVTRTGKNGNECFTVWTFDGVGCRFTVVASGIRDKGSATKALEDAIKAFGD